MAFKAALRISSDSLFMGLVTESLEWFCSGLRSIQLGHDYLSSEPQHGPFRPGSFRLFLDRVTADAVGGKRRTFSRHFLLIEVTHEACGMARRACFDAVDLVDRVAGNTFEVVFFLEFRLVLEPLLECRRELEVAAVVAMRVIVKELRFRARCGIRERPHILRHLAHFRRSMTDQTHFRICPLRASLKGVTIGAGRMCRVVLRLCVRISGHFRILHRRLLMTRSASELLRLPLADNSVYETLVRRVTELRIIKATGRSRGAALSALGTHHEQNENDYDRLLHKTE